MSNLLDTPKLGFGCMRFPLTAEGKIDEPRAAAMLDTAYKAGVTYYDTAYFYHQHTGEAFLGRAMKKLALTVASLICRRRPN